MLLKGKRTFESFITSIANHLSLGDWEMDDEDTAALAGEGVTFGEGEWTALIVMDEDDDGHNSVLGVDLENNSNYSDIEIAVVEKAIGLLEGITWSAGEDDEEPEPRRRERRKHPRTSLKAKNIEDDNEKDPEDD